MAYYYRAQYNSTFPENKIAYKQPNWYLIHNVSLLSECENFKMLQNIPLVVYYRYVQPGGAFLQRVGLKYPN